MKDEDRIRKEISDFVKDGTRDHLEQLSRIILGRNSGPEFLKDLCGHLAGKHNLTFRNIR